MSTPNWINTLSDPLLKSDFTHYAQAGAITETEVAGTLKRLISEVGAKDQVVNGVQTYGSVTTAQVADLKSISQHIASMGGSSYLQFITKTFAGSSLANQYYMGGTSNPQKLGNLAAGYSEQKLTMLVDKWFLGTDLPNPVFVDYSDSTKAPVADAPFTYQKFSAPLYSAGGPNMNDISQGVIGDCYLLASLSEVAKQDPSAIQSMITDNGNQTYGVRFFYNGAPRYVTVDQQLVGAQLDTNNFGQMNNLWGSIVETAYAEVQEQGLINGKSYKYFNSFSSIGNGGYQDIALEEITGASTITDFSAAGKTWTEVVYNQSMVQTSQTVGVTTASLLSTLAADLLVGDALDLDSTTGSTDSHHNKMLVADHSFSIYGFDSATGNLELRNPWGSFDGQSHETTFEVSLKTLLADNDWISSANTGTATTVAGASMVAASALQTMSQVTSFSVTDTAVHVMAGLGELLQDSKLSSLTINGTKGADTLALLGENVATTINLAGNTDAAVVTGFTSTGSGLGQATSFNFGASAFDTALLGAGRTTIDHTLGTGGVEEIVGFNSAYDLLSIGLHGGSLLQTMVNGGDWLSSSSDMTHGVFLAGVTSAQGVTVSNGVATVS